MLDYRRKQTRSECRAPRRLTRPGGFWKSIALMAFGLLGSADAQVEYGIQWWTIDGGGGDSSGSRFGVTGTIGQPDAGFTNNGRLSNQGGFWGLAPYSSAPTPTGTPSLESTMTPTPTRTPSLEPTIAPSPTPTEDSADCDSGYYVLDSLGGRHAVGDPPVITGPVFFGWDIARDMERASCNIEGATVEDLVLLDGFGATHFVMNPSCNVLQDFYFIDQVDKYPQGRAVDMENLGGWKGSVGADRLWRHLSCRFHKGRFRTFFDTRHTSWERNRIRYTHRSAAASFRFSEPGRRMPDGSCPGRDP